MKHCVGLLIASLLAFVAATPAFAHHAFGGEFDPNRPVLLKGKIVKVEWVNPHAHMTFDVKGNDGKIKPWTIEFFGVTGLRKMGLANKNVMKIGDTYALVVSPARDGSNTGLIQKLTFPDGRQYGTASVPADLR